MQIADGKASYNTVEYAAVARERKAGFWLWRSLAKENNMSKALVLLALLPFVFSQPSFPKPGFLHPGCTLTYNFTQDCPGLADFLADEYSMFSPGPNGFYYNLQQTSANDAGEMFFLGNVTNPGSWYNFDTLVSFTPGETSCLVSGQSRSRMVTLFSDGYANFCNTYVLFKGFGVAPTVSKCKSQPADLSICSTPPK